MKIPTTILLLTFFAAIQLKANIFAQGVTFSFKDALISDIFKEVERQTKYEFIYPSKELYNKRISMSVKNANIDEVMKLCLKGLPFRYYVNGVRIVVIKENVTNEKDSLKSGTSKSIIPIDITGRVVNEKGEPIVGATITVKGTSLSTASGTDGYFSFRGIDSKSQIIVSSIGYEARQIRITNGIIPINVRLSVIAQEMKEVIISTGYQNVKPNELVSSIYQVDNKTLNQQVGPNILDRLRDVSSGVLFDNKPLIEGQKKYNITVRGISTINGQMDPLIVVDNFPYEGDINNINPNDIESLQILKDASATAIYGSRGGNGVIVITTKKAKLKQNPELDIYSTITFSPKPNLTYLPTLSSSNYIDFEQFLFNKGYYNTEINNQTLTRSVLTPAVDIFLKRRSNLISPADSALAIDMLRSKDLRKDLIKHIYSNSLTQQYGARYSGGGQNNAYNFSANFVKVKGILGETSKKVNLNFVNTFVPIKFLTINLGVYYTNSISESGANPFIKNGNRSVPYLELTDNQGKPVSIAPNYNDTYTDTAGQGKLLDWKYYPLNDFKFDKKENKLEDIVYNISVTAKVTSIASLELLYQYETQTGLSTRNAQIESYYTRNLINTYSQINHATGEVINVIPKGGILESNSNFLKAHNLRAQLNLRKSFDQKHSIVTLLGTEYRNIVNKNNFGTFYGYSSDPLIVLPVDYVNSYPTYVYGNSTNIPGQPYLRQTNQQFLSFFFNTAYTFKQRYLFNLSLRQDGSNIFGAKTNDKWKPLWSAGAGWNISDEGFFNINWISELRLKGTFGYSGNVDLRRSALPVESIGAYNPYTNLPYGMINVLNDPSLKWEKVSTSNLGIEFSILNSFLSGSIEYYVKKGSDLYGPAPYDYTSWGQLPFINQNLAKIKGTGIDVVFNSKILNKGLKWNAQLLFSRNTNKVTEYLDETAKQLTQLFGDGSTITPVVGKPVYSIAATRWGGLDDKGNPQGYLKGKLSTNYRALLNDPIRSGDESTLLFIGSSRPTTFGSLTNSLSYRHFVLSINLSYKMGYYFRKPALNYSSLAAYGLNGTKDFENRWQKPGEEKFTNVPSLIYPLNTQRETFYSYSEVNVLKGDHIRIAYINFEYQLPKRYRTIPAPRQVCFFINVTNLGIIWRANNEKLDPEYPSSLPPAKAFSFGVRMNY